MFKVYDSLKKAKDFHVTDEQVHIKYMRWNVLEFAAAHF